MLNTQPSIIYFAQVDKEIVFSFTNTGGNTTIVYFDEEQYGIEPSITISITKNLLAGDTVVAYSSESVIDYLVVDNGVDITPVQKLVPSINLDSLQLRKSKLESAIQYLAVNVTASNITNFITTNRNTMIDYERGLDSLQTAITASAAAYLTAQRKTDLLNILN
ncbi:hypothetical protein UFOVP1015_33 [uncultured Caudovirales phage]|uniref:Uncharacterized protein n=1 Tax=uncultured Caudovirales phage TaxID=2100421 RepID=A0A6J5Q172_9CAUD|nr:hypothetical protein UFOVP1015_33 [uncultured Caudovirales phage]CAB5229224.1 hypothetical protein UFOVP1551_14 [uncultured Caudovirales phage]